MNACEILLSGARLEALGCGALWWPEWRLLCLSDLHLGKSERIARRGGALLPPYETRDTLVRLARVLAEVDAETVVCLGDSFDDDAARAGLAPEAHDMLAGMQAGRRWVWISGNHDPGGTGGLALPEWCAGPLTFRHVAERGALGEILGHYHPKARLSVRGRPIARPCFLHDGARIILPAFGTYTGGLDWTDAAFAPLLDRGARAVLTGPAARALPVPRRAVA